MHVSFGYVNKIAGFVKPIFSNFVYVTLSTKNEEEKTCVTVVPHPQFGGLEDMFSNNPSELTEQSVIETFNSVTLTVCLAGRHIGDSKHQLA